jgi:hypothetical protein
MYLCWPAGVQSINNVYAIVNKVLCFVLQYAETVFSKTENIEFFLQKNVICLKYCMGARHLTADRKLIK